MISQNTCNIYDHSRIVSLWRITTQITYFTSQHQMTKKLIFIYNAESWLWNAISDSIHKFVSPDTYPCKLCDITHGYFREKKERHNFLQNITVPVEFYHKDEIKEFQYTIPSLPCVLYIQNDLIVWKISGDDRKDLHTVDDLIQTLRKKIKYFA